jgi:hypothetical protein
VPQGDDEPAAPKPLDEWCRPSLEAPAGLDRGRRGSRTRPLLVPVLRVETAPHAGGERREDGRQER